MRQLSVFISELMVLYARFCLREARSLRALSYAEWSRVLRVTLLRASSHIHTQSEVAALSVAVETYHISSMAIGTYNEVSIHTRQPEKKLRRELEINGRTRTTETVDDDDGVDDYI